jgi:hypothetical protein
MEEKTKNESLNEEIDSKLSFKQRVDSYFHPQGVQREMMRYRPNSISEFMVVLALACVVAAFSTIYGFRGTADVVDWQIGIDIFGAIIMMLFSFLAAEEMKNYSQKWSYVSFGLAALDIVRMFIYPFYLLNFKVYDAVTDTYVASPQIDNVRFAAVIVLCIVAAVLYIIAGILTLYRGAALRAYLKNAKPIENEIINKGK